MDAASTLLYRGKSYTIVSTDPVSGEITARLTGSRAVYQPRLFRFTNQGQLIGAVARTDNRIACRFPAPRGSVELEIQTMLATMLRTDVNELPAWQRWVVEEYNALLLTCLEKENQQSTHPLLLDGVADVMYLLRSS